MAVFNDTTDASEEAATLYHEQRLRRIADNAATGTIVNDDRLPKLACATWATRVVSQTLAAHPGRWTAPAKNALTITKDTPKCATSPIQP